MFKLIKKVVNRVSSFVFCNKKSNKMQRQTTILPQPLLLNPLKDSVKVKAVDYSADFQNLYSRVDNFIKLYVKGQLPYNMVRDIPGLTKIAYQI